MKILFFILKAVLRKLCIKPIILISFWILIKVQVSFGQYSCGDHKVYVCHKGKNTLCIDESAVQAHLNHGDYLGPCGSNECNVLALGRKITCKDTIVTLVAISDTPGVSYNWSGPNNFTSSLNSPSTDIPGIYTVTITDTSNGCTASDSALITQDTLKPGATAGGGNITCANTSAILSGNSGTSGVIFKWTGPEGYTSNQQNTLTTEPGEYILSVTNPLNGCISVDTTIIQQNNTIPEDVVTTVLDTLTCIQTFVTLTGTSSTSGVTYNWSGPNGFSSTEQNPLVINPGIYKLVVADSESGCTSSASVLVEQNTIYPSDVLATVSGILTCTDTTVILTGSSNSSGMTYSWLDPNSFNFTGNSAVISIPGTYILTVTNTVNNCSKSASVTVEQNITAPEELTASVSDTLDCIVKSVMLSASSTSNGILYRWTGPENFESNEQFEETSVPGSYKVTATNPVNGCIAEKLVTIIEEECQTP